MSHFALNIRLEMVAHLSLCLSRLMEMRKFASVRSEYCVPSSLLSISIMDYRVNYSFRNIYRNRAEYIQYSTANKATLERQKGRNGSQKKGRSWKRRPFGQIVVASLPTFLDDCFLSDPKWQRPILVSYCLPGSDFFTPFAIIMRRWENIAQWHKVR